MDLQSNKSMSTDYASTGSKVGREKHLMSVLTRWQVGLRRPVNENITRIEYSRKHIWEDYVSMNYPHQA